MVAAFFEYFNSLGVMVKGCNAGRRVVVLAKYSRMAADPVAKPCKPCCEMFSERELESLEPKLYLGGLYGLSIYHREFRVIMRMLNVCLTFVNKMRNVGYECEMIRALQF